MKWLASVSLPTLAFAALGLEISGSLILVSVMESGIMPGMALFQYGALHFGASMLVARTLLMLFPKEYRRPPRHQSMFVVFLLSFFIPFFGVPGVMAGILSGLHLPRKTLSRPFAVIGIPELPYKPLLVSEQPLYGSGGLIGVIRNAPDPEKRIRAVMATRQLRDRDAVPILRAALRDPVDDVRLLAYSLLDRKEQRINERIKTLLEELYEADGRSAGILHEQIAAQYWELAYLGLAVGDVQRHVLEQSLRHLNDAHGLLPPDAGRLFQRGRVHLRLGRLDMAENDMHDALDLGMDTADVYPYLAEIHFLRRNWLRVRDFINEIDESMHIEPPFSMIVRYWRGAE